MSDSVGLPAPTPLVKDFSVEDVDEVVKSSESIRCHFAVKEHRDIVAAISVRH